MKSIIFKCLNYFNILYLKLKKCKIGKNVRVNGFLYISNHGQITIGDNVTINSGQRFNPVGGASKTRIFAYKNSEIIIENNVGISNTTIVSSKKILIGENTLIGASCNIMDTDFHSIKALDRLKGDNDIKTKEIIIKDNVFVGAHSMILKGTIIGYNSVIGAGSVVSNKNIPDNELWAGNPISLIRNI